MSEVPNLYNVISILSTSGFKDKFLLNITLELSFKWH